MLPVKLPADIAFASNSPAPPLGDDE